MSNSAWTSKLNLHDLLVPRLLFLAAVILAVTLWPLLQHVMGMVPPHLDSNLKTGSSSWDLRSM
ncbi:MAG: hypothetical protein DMG56_11570 [Acidobacteria bacterium]|nr:MAG: hypothetical protein DMG55_29660 [Acidobacteriota bacterium]PYU62563.1 MAG: hypothetical protein DMG56_11570 [Acidobacteriota bacterium]